MDRTFQSSKFVVYVNIALAPVMALLIIGFVVYAAYGDVGPTGSRVQTLTVGIVIALFLVILAPIAYVSVRMASQIRVKDDSVIEFRGPMVRATLNPSAITSVRSSPWVRKNWVDVKHSTGRVQVYVPIDGFYEFLGWLKRKNPNVEIRWL